MASIILLLRRFICKPAPPHVFAALSMIRHWTCPVDGFRAARSCGFPAGRAGLCVLLRRRDASSGRTREPCEDNLDELWLF
jgi:hypothetical protein